MSGARSIAAPIRDTPAAWIILLKSAASAEAGALDLDGGTPQMVMLAERLVDLGFLRVPRAGHYALTPAGRELLGQDKTSPAPIRPRKRIPLLLPLSIPAIGAVALWLWLSQ
jgi:hypothetical protein